MRFLKIQFIMFLFSSSSALGQNFPACDSLTINCCTFNTGGSNTISLSASNYSSVLFDYPGFILFNSNMDTIAVETVNYFGIGGGPQDHIMNIVAPITLPFAGFLNLYILFNDTLACSFPITIPDTTTGILVVSVAKSAIEIVPNPVGNESFVKINTGILKQGNVVIKIFKAEGQVVRNEILHFGNSTATDINIQNLLQGFYIVQVEQNGQFYTARLVKL